MDLTTHWMGLELPHPLVAGASPLSDTLDGVRRLEDAGSAAIVLRSLFEEQILAESLAAHDARAPHEESHAEAKSYAPEPETCVFGPDEYLNHLARAAEAVDVPVIGSLNGVTDGGWLEFARAMESAGAAALELNLFHVATDPDETAEEIERRAVGVVERVRADVSIPLAVKVARNWTALPNLVRRFQEAGAGGIVLFNRTLHPDIDPEALEGRSDLRLSEPHELRIRLRWLAILSGRLDVELAVTGGVHDELGAIRAVMAGASTVQMVSTLLVHGLGRLADIRAGMERWMEEHEYESLGQMRGSMDLSRCPDPSLYERGNYMRLLQTWIQSPTP